jgi:VWFA-related protein
LRCFLSRRSRRRKTNQQETIRIKTDLVTLDALVTDKKTREIIRNLTIQDFELFEDDARQQIEHFSQDKLPLSVVLPLDISPSVHPVIEEIQKGALQAPGHLKPEDEVALMVFAGVPELIQDFTKDRKVIADKVGLALTRDGHGARIHEAIGAAARQFKHATIPTSRRVVIVITDNQGSMNRKYDNVSEAEIKDALHARSEEASGRRGLDQRQTGLLRDRQGDRGVAGRIAFGV